MHMNDQTPRILLVAVNAKYIHSNPAVYSLSAYAASLGFTAETAEFTINQPEDEVLACIYRNAPEIVCFSVYIWNRIYTQRLIRSLKKVLPGTEIWAGGPEVSFHPEKVLEDIPGINGIMRGEGEKTFAGLCRVWTKAGPGYEDIPGITYRNGSGEIRSNPDRPCMNMDEIPFLYTGRDFDRNRIYYYESSRGCPYRCTYCLSSVDKTVRTRSLEKVFAELSVFLSQKVSQVKFVDRTFNLDAERTTAIWRYIKENDNGITGFHFEISGERLSEDEIRLLSIMRPGQVRLEIGIQSTNPDTLSAIERHGDTGRLFENCRRILKPGNIRLHLDLIAGLPHEDLDSFRRSFNEVYALKPSELQLGFLKVLKGTPMEEKTEEYGLAFKDLPPYEVLSTSVLSYGDILLLKDVEEMTEVYYNSGQFIHSLKMLEKCFPDGFAMYEALAAFCRTKKLTGISHSRIRRYEILLDFYTETVQEGDREKFAKALLLDLYARENLKNRPDFAPEYEISKEEERAFYEKEAEEHRFLPDYTENAQTLKRLTHLEAVPGGIVLFDYRNRNPVTGNAREIYLEKTLALYKYR